MRLRINMHILYHDKKSISRCKFTQLYAFWFHNIDIMSQKSSIKKQSEKIIVFTGGGTGGHVYPNLALIKEFEKRGYKAVYVGGKGDTIENRLARERDIPYHGVDTIKFVRSFNFDAIKNNIKIPLTLKKSITETTELLKKISPVCVFSKGGFVSLPVVCAAKKLGLPIFAHESDLTLGLANKIAANKGATVFKANPHSTFKGVFSGMPLRDDLFKKSKTEAYSNLSIANPRGKNVLLILGGSSGAKALNDAVIRNLDALTRDFVVLHVFGKDKTVKITHGDYFGFEYADDISLFYAASDVVVSRAGATAVFEISALQKRALFAPLPKGVSRGDQIFNANLAKEYGANILIQDDEFERKFVQAVKTAASAPPMKIIANDANGKIADIVCDTLRRGEKCKNKKPSPNGLA